MRGWLLDLYSESPGKMVVWMKLESGETKRLVDRWANSFFVAADDKRDLAAIESGRTWRDEFSWSRRVMRYERATDIQESEVLELVVDDARKLPRLAGRIERSMPFGTYRIYNVDVPQEQMYLYENDLFPLAECEVSETRDGLAWELRDDIWSCKYTVPELRSLGVRPEIERSGRLPRFDDPIRSIELKHCDGSASVIDGESEADKLLTFVEEVRRADPDIIFTNDGDAFVLPYLAKRASVNGIAEKFSIDREGKVLEAPAKKGTTYFSYGKILFKPSAVKLLGRIHLDTTSSFVQRETGLDGFYEVSRVCRLPLHTASRASIGKALSSLQFYYATKDGILIPWKPALAESFKTRAELLVGDRGGFIFEPELGVHEQIGELDFSSLFPSIMAKKNISPETVRCGCCPDSSNRVPELDWNVCERRPEGIVAKSVKILVEKKMKYKRLEQIAKTERERASYHARRDALKWTSVACLPRGSPILIRQDGIDRYERIGDFIDGLVGKREGVIECPSRVYTPGVGSDYKTRYCKIARLIKKPNDQKLLSFVMEGGRKIVTTPNHPFFILDGGKLVVKEATELRGGDLVPVGRAIPPANEIKQVDLIEKLENLLLSKEKELWRVSGEKLKEAIKAKLPTLLRAAAQEGYSNGGVISWSKSGIIPLKFFGLLELNPLVHRSLRVGPGRRQGGRIAWLPAILDIDERLGFFLGFYVADGSATGNMVRLDVALSEPELLETLVKLVESLFKISPHVSKEKRARMWVIQINSAGLVRILEKVFGQPGSSDNGKLKVPDVILNGSAEAAHRFMAGMLAGDGNAGKRKRYVQISTKSKELQNQICFLAARLRLAFRMKTEREDDRTMYTVAFVGPETLGRIGNWEYSKEGQREKIQSWSKESPPATCTHAIYDRLPIEESGLFALAKSTRTSSDPHTRKELRQCPAIVERKISRILSRKLDDRQLEQPSRMQKLAGSDLRFVRIKKIVETDSSPEFVYCFQLENGEMPGFFTGEGLVFTHNCFGYLGHANAKFGRIDAHIAVCAWDRKVLIDAARVAERRGFRVMHGIVDSLWLKKDGATEDDYRRVRREIEEATGFTLSFEGIYKWIAFLPSKVHEGVPVLNRYFGAYRDGKLKIRGIDARRHDTPAFFSSCQLEMLEALAKASGVEEARGMVDECVGIFLKHARMLLEHRAPIGGLVFTRNISKNPGEYTNRSLTAVVAEQLVREGLELHAGEGVQYVITGYDSKSPSKRAVPFELVDERTVYDSKRYVQLLAEACESVLRPFRADCTAEWLVGALEKTRHINAY